MSMAREVPATTEYMVTVGNGLWSKWRFSRERAEQELRNAEECYPSVPCKIVAVLPLDAYDAAQAKAAALQAQVTVLTDRNAELERLRDHPEPLGVVVDDEMARRYLDFVYKGREYSNLEVIEVQRQLTAALRGAKTVPLESVGQAKESTFPQWYHETLWRVIDAAQAQVAALRGRLERVKNCLPEQPTLLRGSDGELHEMLFADDVRAALTQETNT